MHSCLQTVDLSTDHAPQKCPLSSLLSTATPPIPSPSLTPPPPPQQKHENNSPHLWKHGWDVEGRDLLGSRVLRPRPVGRLHHLSILGSLPHATDGCGGVGLHAHVGGACHARGELVGHLVCAWVQVQRSGKHTHAQKAQKQLSNWVCFWRPVNQYGCTQAKKIQTHERFERALIYYDTDNTMPIFREIPFFRPQNET